MHNSGKNGSQLVRNVCCWRDDQMLGLKRGREKAAVRQKWTK